MSRITLFIVTGRVCYAKHPITSHELSFAKKRCHALQTSASDCESNWTRTTKTDNCSGQFAEDSYPSHTHTPV